MQTQQKMEKAKLLELDSKFTDVINKDKAMTVQFNPESLKVSLTNQIAQPQGAGNQKEPAAMQFVGAGSSKLTLQLWFDVNGLFHDEIRKTDDVRKLTEKVAYFITPREVKPSQYAAPAVRFEWGTFQFDGIIESMEESLEMFSSDGKPQRASVSLAMSQQRITKYAFAPGGSSPGAAPSTPGTQPLTPASEGSTIQTMAAAQGLDDWQSIAQANGIENPRLLLPGQLVDLNVQIGEF
jgi:hypothetical protein